MTIDELVCLAKVLGAATVDDRMNDLGVELEALNEYLELEAQSREGDIIRLNQINEDAVEKMNELRKAKRPTARWVSDSPGICRCSACKELAPYNPRAAEFYTPAYCPNCGAYMREEAEQYG